MSILSVEHLTKIYGEGDTAVRALDDVSFTVEAGEFIAIVGSSGSGKSTLLHIIGGVDRPTSGSVYVQGQDIYRRTDEQLAVFRRREVGLIYQFYNLIPVLDVIENMTLPVLMDGRRVNQERLEQLTRARAFGTRTLYAIATIGRAAAARRGGPGAYELPRHRARRRADGQSR